MCYVYLSDDVYLSIVDQRTFIVLMSLSVTDFFES